MLSKGAISEDSRVSTSASGSGNASLREKLRAASAEGSPNTGTPTKAGARSRSPRSGQKTALAPALAMATMARTARGSVNSQLDASLGRCELCERQLNTSNKLRRHPVGTINFNNHAGICGFEVCGPCVHTVATDYVGQCKQRLRIAFQKSKPKRTEFIGVMGKWEVTHEDDEFDSNGCIVGPQSHLECYHSCARRKGEGAHAHSISAERSSGLYCEQVLFHLWGPK